MSWWLLLLIVMLVWLLWMPAAILQKAAENVAKRVPKDQQGGVSILPVFPLFPLILFAVAKLTDLLVSPWGTAVIASLHALLALLLLISIVRDWYRLRSATRVE
jgi:hypothetical protein